MRRRGRKTCLMWNVGIGENESQRTMRDVRRGRGVRSGLKELVKGIVDAGRIE